MKRISHESNKSFICHIRVNQHSGYAAQPRNCFCNGDLAISKRFSCDVFDIFENALWAVTLDAIFGRSSQHKAYFVLV